MLDELAGVDVGIVPNLLPIHDPRRALRRTASLEPSLAYEPYDYLLRLKASSNPGRMYPFARLGIPVVADLTPSLAQFVLDGVSGFLAASPQGWLDALERLAEEPALRSSMAVELRTRLDAAYDRQVADLLAFLHRPPLGPPTPSRATNGRGRPRRPPDLRLAVAGAAARARRRAPRRLLRP